ncbi:hypothetical protein RSJ21_00450 (plasmid) [Clostridium botulinum]|uniref:hypothetical protein n=1 Tax=Clostridium botulinum TaxID=1491 RepID=UPI000C75C863|nr:hypothetical protein [Clostridium botulinum]AUN23805.1 hypothetical protein RSJ21_00450 [Clostridium botulinum]
MIKSIKKLFFNKEMREHIKNVEGVFNELAKQEGGNESMLDWINENLKALEEDGILEGLSDREKFLFAFAMLSSSLQDILSQ